MWRRISLLMVLVTAIAFLAGCASDRDEAQRVVERMYKAMEARDTDAYLESILPSNRAQPSAMTALAVLSAVSANVGLEGFGLGLDLGQLFGDLSQMSFQNLKFDILQEQNGYALVQVSGQVRYPALLMEFPFCDQHDARKEDGKWFVDVLAPERQARLQRILKIKEQELNAAAQNASPSTGSVEGDVLAALGMLGGSMETMLDLCE